MAGAFLLLASGLPLGTAAQPDLGLFPVISGVVFLLGALALWLPERTQRPMALEEDVEAEDAAIGDAAWRVPVMAAIMTLYIVGTWLVGHMLAAAVSGFLIVRLISAVALWKQILLAVGTAVVSYVVFSGLLGVRMPMWGLL